MADPDREVFEAHERGELGVLATVRALRARALGRKAQLRTWWERWGWWCAVSGAFAAGFTWGAFCALLWRATR